MPIQELRVLARDRTRPDYGFEPFLKLLLEGKPSLGEQAWRVGRDAWGHGEFVGQLGETDDADSSVPITWAAILAALERGEYFWDVVLTRDTDGLQIEVFDSHSLGVIGAPEVVDELEEIIRRSDDFDVERMDYVRTWPS